MYIIERKVISDYYERGVRGCSQEEKCDKIKQGVIRDVLVY